MDDTEYMFGIALIEGAVWGSAGGLMAWEGFPMWGSVGGCLGASFCFPACANPSKVDQWLQDDIKAYHAECRFGWPGSSSPHPHLTKIMPCYQHLDVFMVCVSSICERGLHLVSSSDCCDPSVLCSFECHVETMVLKVLQVQDISIYHIIKISCNIVHQYNWVIHQYNWVIHQYNWVIHSTHAVHW